jgi:hypothetical protein
MEDLEENQFIEERKINELRKKEFNIDDFAFVIIEHEDYTEVQKIKIKKFRDCPIYPFGGVIDYKNNEHFNVFKSYEDAKTYFNYYHQQEIDEIKEEYENMLNRLIK